MLLFLTIVITMFAAEFGDKTQLLMIAMTSRFKLRDIILGAAASILALNALAVGVGGIISQVVPDWFIKLVAGLAFFYFAWSTFAAEDDDEEEEVKESSHPILTVFGTFFIAEFGDKTQLTAITFAANEGLSKAITVWLACSLGLFLADLIGMLIGYLLKSKTPDGFIDKLAFIIFAVFGFTTVKEGAVLLNLATSTTWIVAVAAAAVFVVVCIATAVAHRKAHAQTIEK